MIKEKKTKTAKIREAIRNLKKPKGALFWTIAYVVGMFIYTAILFGLSIGAVGGILSFKSSDDYAFAQELLINWNKNYISDLKVIKVNEDCPAGYELWHDRSWPGIVEGCNCINNNGGFRKLVTRETCTSLQLNSKCEKVEALDSVPLYLWKQNSKVCLLRQDVSFLSSPENCGSGLKRCGQGNVRFCVAEDKPCPITDVVISGVYEKTGYEKVVLSDTENIFFTRDDTNFPISTFELTEAKFCIFDAKDNITPGRLDYILSRSLRRPCVRDETRFVTLDSQGEKSVYQQNNLFTTLKSLPGYPIPSNDYTWNIGFVRYFEWDDLCRNGPYSLHQVEKKIGLSTVLKTAWVAFGVTMISILITGIILPVRHLKLRIREEHMKAAYAKKKKEVPKQQDYKKIFTSAPYLTDKIFKLILLPVLILAIFFTQRENKWFLQAQGNNCGDAITNSYFQTFANKLEEILAIYIALIFIWAIALAADLAYAMFLVLKSNIAIWKFFESKIRKDEEKIVIVTEDELRGLNTSASSRPDSRSKVMPASSDS